MALWLGVHPRDTAQPITDDPTRYLTQEPRIHLAEARALGPTYGTGRSRPRRGRAATGSLRARGPPGLTVAGVRYRQPGNIDEPNRALANEIGAVVVGVTYRKAPESMFPAAHEDAMAALEWVAANVGEHGGDPQRIALDRTPSLAGLPPTLVLTNEYDMMRDEGEQFAEQLAEAGVDVTSRRFEGLVHTVYWMFGAVPAQAEMHDAVVVFLRKRLA